MPSAPAGLSRALGSRIQEMDSKFSNAVMERRLRLRCTFRRVSMLAKLSEQLRAAGDA